ncbi:hypothetical protein [Ruminococcus bicirculans (ex Wegman et al. 2014)]|uniref:hypothetical protein n=1 Tax=Ruminococcus bicirculans (ex Wegman et al. 2014) TaxID=1160721 RepID=UPI00164406F7|nr:hypothetical protein [Ruminococcus bicirculans (ex Wegman et al. 2014)]MBC3513226.1 hypothetical protein [Ruminococcus bicirculans (ex Wegman et al. 2014)]
MNIDLFEDKDAWKKLDAKSLMKIIPNYFEFTGDIEHSAYLNWRFDSINNTENQFYEMGKAYLETAIQLIDVCLKDNSNQKADVWIFPILFNVVHGIEAYLKGFNSQLRILNKIEKLEYQESKIEGKHNILQLCQTAIKLIQQSSHKDILQDFRFVESFITILYANTDDMTFARYPIDSNKRPHFYVNKPNITIDLDVLRIWICKILDILDGCTGFIDFLIDQINEWIYETQQEYED